ncbi:MAG: hypothetical protein PVS3B1_13210 [Ktedonobacteraceae bacterium]
MKAALIGDKIKFEFTSTITKVGRSSKNQLVLNSAEVSWVHAQIEVQGQSYYVIDLDSNNGTYVNEHKLPPHTRHRLNEGDTVRFGNTTLNYTNNASTHSPTKRASFSSTATTLSGGSSSSQSGYANWIKFAGGIASLATVFGVIWGVFTYMHPAVPPPSPFPSPVATNSPAIPGLHSSYKGQLIRVDGTTYIFTISTLVEDAHGHFTAISNDSCPGEIQGSVNADTTINFMMKEAEIADCGLVGQFKGQVSSEGRLSGTWQGAVSQTSGTWWAA